MAVFMGQKQGKILEVLKPLQSQRNRRPAFDLQGLSIGAEKTAIGTKVSLAFSSCIRLMILGIPLPSTSRRLPPNLATESVLKAYSTFDTISFVML